MQSFKNQNQKKFTEGLREGGGGGKVKIVKCERILNENIFFGVF